MRLAPLGVLAGRGQLLDPEPPWMSSETKAEVAALLCRDGLPGKGHQRVGERQRRPDQHHPATGVVGLSRTRQQGDFEEVPAAVAYSAVAELLPVEGVEAARRGRQVLLHAAGWRIARLLVELVGGFGPGHWVNLRKPNTGTFPVLFQSCSWSVPRTAKSYIPNFCGAKGIAFSGRPIIVARC